jgi:hypothetical protein
MFGMSKQAKAATGDAAKPGRAKAAATLEVRDASLVGVEVKLSPAQRDKLQRLGGDAWIRQQIDKARPGSKA